MSWTQPLTIPSAPPWRSKCGGSRDPRMKPGRGTSRTLHREAAYRFLAKAPCRQGWPQGGESSKLTQACSSATQAEHLMPTRGMARQGIWHNAKINRGPTSLPDKPAAAHECPSWRPAGEAESSCRNRSPRPWQAGCPPPGRGTAGTVRQQDASSNNWATTKTNCNNLISKRALCMVYFV